MTKSKNLELYLEFLDYEDPRDIPFPAIAAKYDDVTPNRLRGMMRPAKNNPTIFIALVDELGVDPDDIPHWFARPTRYRVVKKKRKKASAYMIQNQPQHPSPRQYALPPRQPATPKPPQGLRARHAYTRIPYPTTIPVQEVFIGDYPIATTVRIPEPPRSQL